MKKQPKISDLLRRIEELEETVDRLQRSMLVIQPSPVQITFPVFIPHYRVPTWHPYPEITC
jgi:hypothetical protein